MTEGVCIHGGLRRQCETCNLADRLEQADEKLRAIATLVNGFHNEAVHAWWETGEPPPGNPRHARSSRATETLRAIADMLEGGPHPCEP